MTAIEGEVVGFDHLLPSPETLISRPGRLRLDGATIAAVETDSAPAPATGCLLLPALSNAHDHGRGLRTLAFGAPDDALEVWLTRLKLEPVADPYLRSLVAFGRMAEGGIGIANHCHNTQRFEELFAEAEAARRAVHTIGMRIAFAVPLIGHNPVVYGDPELLYQRLPREQAEALKASAGRFPGFAEQLAVAEDIFGLADDLFTIQYCPMAPQWVDEATLRTVAERSALHGRRVHMHMFETLAQREWADVAYPGGLVRHLDQIGLLSPRLTLAHGVYFRADEFELLAERGVHISVNTSSNLRLRSGIAPVRDMIAAGVTFGMGMDGMAFDEDEDALREMRLLWTLQRGFGFEEVLTPARLLQAVLFDGRNAILGPGAAVPLAPGAPADLLTLHLDRLGDDLIDGRFDIVDLLLTRAAKRAVGSLFVAGREIIRAGKVTGCDLAAAEEEFISRARHAAGEVDLAAVATMSAAYRDYYACGCHRMLGDRPVSCEALP